MDTTDLLRGHFRTLARYHVWATERLLDGAATVRDDDWQRPCGVFFTSLHGTLNHLLLAEERAWWPRFTGEQAEPYASLGDEIEPERARLCRRLLDVAGRWQDFVGAIPDDRWAGDLAYLRQGQPQALPYAATLAHVFNHATHHRGQATAALTALGYACPELDLVRLLQAEQREASA
jgi:uncharacterized damage-inducible protein DinB